MKTVMFENVARLLLDSPSAPSDVINCVPLINASPCITQKMPLQKLQIKVECRNPCNYYTHWIKKVLRNQFKVTHLFHYLLKAKLVNYF